MKKPIFIFLIIIAVTGISSSYVYFFIYNKPHQNIANAIPAYTLTTEQLYTEYNTDEKKADRKYLGKIIEIKGFISQITNDKTSITLEFKKEDDMGGVIVSLDSAYYEQYKHLTIGQPITIKGVCVGNLTDVTINRGIIIK